MPVASDGYRAALARHRPMPEPTSSSLAMAGLPLYLFFDSLVSGR